jgi:hypothetical protein
MTERTLASVGASWTDLGDWIEKSYTEDEMCELAATARKEGVEEGIKIGKARAAEQWPLRAARSFGDGGILPSTTR